MSESRVSTPPARPRIERLQPWLAALVSALLHVLMLAILMWAKPPPVFTDPQGAASGGRIRVDFIGQPQPVSPSDGGGVSTGVLLAGGAAIAAGGVVAGGVAGKVFGGKSKEEA